MWPQGRSGRRRVYPGPSRGRRKEWDRPDQFRTVRGQRNHAGAVGSSGSADRQAQNRHSIVTDSTMTIAITKGISLVMRQNRLERVDVPA